MLKQNVVPIRESSFCSFSEAIEREISMQNTKGFRLMPDFRWQVVHGPLCPIYTTLLIFEQADTRTEIFSCPRNISIT